uniref:Uncharacterized protein n=1 Tax=Rhizophora mucronata TaxID=61149 RepID=A0A2P2Q581_RHIMU
MYRNVPFGRFSLFSNIVELQKCKPYIHMVRFCCSLVIFIDKSKWTTIITF